MAVFINPYTDFGFKKLFGEEQNKHLLISFLNDLFSDSELIVDLTFKNTEHLSSGGEQRKAVYDIYCTNDKGEHFIVEMPNFAKNLEQLESHCDRWLYFIKNLAELEYIPQLFVDDIIYQGFETARLASLDEQEREVYRNSLKEYRDMFSVMEAAKQEGFDEGKEEGELHKANAGAINLIRMKLLSDKQIAQAMGLTAEQVGLLRASLMDNDSE